jgi:hypothetical protein
VGALLGGAIALITALLVSREQSSRALKLAADQRSFDQQENRLRDRLDAYVAFAGVMAKLITSEERYEADRGYSHEDEDGPTEPVFFLVEEEALTHLEILVPALYPAGRAYLDEFYAAWHPKGFGRRAASDDLERARTAFLVAARTELGLG